MSFSKAKRFAYSPPAGYPVPALPIKNNSPKEKPRQCSRLTRKKVDQDVSDTDKFNKLNYITPAQKYQKTQTKTISDYKKSSNFDWEAFKKNGLNLTYCVKKPSVSKNIDFDDILDNIEIRKEGYYEPIEFTEDQNYLYGISPTKLASDVNEEIYEIKSQCELLKTILLVDYEKKRNNEIVKEDSYFNSSTDNLELLKTILSFNSEKQSKIIKEKHFLNSSVKEDSKILNESNFSFDESLNSCDMMCNSLDDIEIGEEATELFPSNKNVIEIVKKSITQVKNEFRQKLNDSLEEELVAYKQSMEKFMEELQHKHLLLVNQVKIKLDDTLSDLEFSIEGALTESLSCSYREEIFYNSEERECKTSCKKVMEELKISHEVEKKRYKDSCKILDDELVKSKKNYEDLQTNHKKLLCLSHNMIEDKEFVIDSLQAELEALSLEEKLKYIIEQK